MLHLNGTYLSHVYLKADRASAVVSTGLTLYHPLSAGGQKKRWSGPYPAQRDPRPHTGCWWRLLLRNNVYPDSQWGFRTRCIALSAYILAATRFDSSKNMWSTTEHSVLMNPALCLPGKNTNEHPLNWMSHSPRWQRVTQKYSWGCTDSPKTRTLILAGSNRASWCSVPPLLTNRDFSCVCHKLQRPSSEGHPPEKITRP